MTETEIRLVEALIGVVLFLAFMGYFFYLDARGHTVRSCILWAFRRRRKQGIKKVVFVREGPLWVLTAHYRDGFKSQCLFFPEMKEFRP